MTTTQLTAAGLKVEFTEHVADFDVNPFLGILRFGKVVSQRKDKSGAIKVGFEDGTVCFYYKGIRIQEDKMVPSGYWGRWRAYTYDTECRGIYHSKLRDVVEEIKKIAVK
jgi:hypothetical protein